MNRIDTCFQNLAASGRKALIPYITCGDPSIDISLALMHGMVEAGVDIIELGIPFSDPMADGPVIQKAHERALANGVGLLDCLDVVSSFRQKNDYTPVVLMGYLNTLEVLGYDAAAEACARAGVDGLLLVDMPPEETSQVASCFRDRDLSLIFLLAPTTTDERARSICEAASGYLYYVSLKGVTGSANLDTGAAAERLSALRQMTRLPIAVGFGIRDAASARAVADFADGVIVGSALVNEIEAQQADPVQMLSRIKSILREMREQMDA
jgi:tryptophan synthase alpha chain